MQETMAVIVARMDDYDFPRRPMMDVLGSPMFAWIVDAARKARYVAKVLVVTDSQEVVDACPPEI